MGSAIDPPLNRLIDRDLDATSPVPHTSVHTSAAEMEVRRVQPASPFWLEVTAPISCIPSISAQMARRLGALGVRNIEDLVELDADSTEIPLDGLQVSPAQLRRWQSEGRYLCCVPHLTGRDVQLIVAAGYETPSALAGATADAVRAEIDRVHGGWETGSLLSRTGESRGTPSAKSLQRWIQLARQRRSWRQACQWSARREPEGWVDRRRRRRQQRRLAAAEADREQIATTNGSTVVSKSVTQDTEPGTGAGRGD